MILTGKTRDINTFIRSLHENIYFLMISGDVRDEKQDIFGEVGPYNYVLLALILKRMV